MRFWARVELGQGQVQKAETSVAVPWWSYRRSAGVLPHLSKPQVGLSKQIKVVSWGPQNQSPAIVASY